MDAVFEGGVEVLLFLLIKLRSLVSSPLEMVLVILVMLSAMKSTLNPYTFELFSSTFDIFDHELSSLLFMALSVVTSITGTSNAFLEFNFYAL